MTYNKNNETIVSKQHLKNIIKEQLFKTLYGKDRIKLASGKMTKYYFDIRKISTAYYFNKLIGYCYYDIIEKLEADYLTKKRDFKVGGLETGAIPIIMSIINEYQLDGFYIRKEQKKHGMKQQIEGVLSDYCFLVDDVVTTGKSILKCIDVIKRYNSNCKILGVFPLIDRNKELENYDLFFQLKSKDIEYRPIFSSMEFIEPI